MTSLPFTRLLTRSLVVLMATCGTAAAQDLGSVDPKPLPALEHPDDPKTPAKELFGRKIAPTKAPARSVGFYSRGCRWRHRATDQRPDLAGDAAIAQPKLGPSGNGQDAPGPF